MNISKKQIKGKKLMRSMKRNKGVAILFWKELLPKIRDWIFKPEFFMLAASQI